MSVKKEKKKKRKRIFWVVWFHPYNVIVLSTAKLSQNVIPKRFVVVINLTETHYRAWNIIAPLKMG